MITIVQPEPFSWKQQFPSIAKESRATIISAIGTGFACRVVAAVIGITTYFFQSPRQTPINALASSLLAIGSTATAVIISSHLKSSISLFSAAIMGTWHGCFGVGIWVMGDTPLSGTEFIAKVALQAGSTTQTIADLPYTAFIAGAIYRLHRRCLQAISFPGDPERERIFCALKIPTALLTTAAYAFFKAENPLDQFLIFSSFFVTIIAIGATRFLYHSLKANLTRCNQIVLLVWFKTIRI